MKLTSFRLLLTAAGLALLAAPSPLPAASAPWVEHSNVYALKLLRIIGKYSPEEATSHGLQDFDRQVADLSVGVDARERAELTAVRADFAAALATETDPPVREDLQILMHACDVRIEGSALEEKDLLNYSDISGLIFQGEMLLLRDQTAPGRRPVALDRLKNYLGLSPGSTSVFLQAKSQFQDSLGTPGRLGPFRGDVEQDLANVDTYTSGVHSLFTKYNIPESDAALAALDAQAKDYDTWVRASVLPKARADFHLPAELYAHRLLAVGLGITPQELIRKAEFEWAEARNELIALAPLVAKEHGYPSSDYRDVIRELKKQQLSKDEIEPYYRDVIIPQIEATIRREHIITLPDRPLAMMLASAAETAVQPAPHYRPPPIIHNTGEHGEFILPLGTPPTAGKDAESYDDFTFKAAAWTLTAHEGRPGHDLQFSSMVERGVSLARSIFAFNSVNVEGWALYSEAEFKPFEPLDGQMIALQHRLMRATRAICDPMLNLGLMTTERVHEILTRDVCLSEALTHEELDRFTFKAPGQATSYFYGYSKLMELRTATEMALGSRFSRQAFNDFVIGQGLLPPELLATAVEKEFIPAQGP